MPETGNPVSSDEEETSQPSDQAERGRGVALENAGDEVEGAHEEGVSGSNGNGAVDRRSAAGMFAELVGAHYDLEKHPNETRAVERYHHTLEQFQAYEGEITHVYWSSKRASAVALTVKRRGKLAQWALDDDAVIRLHRVTDWLEPEYRIAELLHHCDTLAIKVSQVLRGTSERIAMQWIYAVQSHLVGYLERSDHARRENGAHRELTPSKRKELNAVIRSQARELIQIERYYSQAAEKASRIVYFWGMMVGAVLSGLIGLGIAAILKNGGWFDEPHTLATQTFIICFAAGGLGAIVSVLMRMSSNRFGVDYEVGQAPGQLPPVHRSGVRHGPLLPVPERATAHVGSRRPRHVVLLLRHPRVSRRLQRAVDECPAGQGREDAGCQPRRHPERRAHRRPGGLTMDDDYVDDDPEYETEEDDDAVIAGLTAVDPSSVPPDQGDAGKEGN